MKVPRKPLRCCIMLAMLTVLGCGRDDKLTPVRGQVFFRDRPLSGGTIVFIPDPERGGRGPLACGEIDSDGRYDLRPGAAPGWHRVTIAAALTVPASESPAHDFPRRYSDAEHSGLLREVHAGKLDAQNFHLE